MTRVQCERSRKGISLQLDGMLSTFEVALLNRHLRGCSSCRAFADSAAAQTRLLREAELELPLRPVVIRAPARRVGWSAGGTLGAALVAAAAALMLVLPGVRNHTSGRAQASASAGPVLVAYAARPTLAAKIEVPRLRVQPASIADGPVHGAFSVPFV